MPTFKPAQLVVTEDDTPGRVTVGVLVNGAFIPIADPPAGHVATRAKVSPAKLSDEAPPEPPAE